MYGTLNEYYLPLPSFPLHSPLFLPSFPSPSCPSPPSFCTPLFSSLPFPPLLPLPFKTHKVGILVNIVYMVIHTILVLVCESHPLPSTPTSAPLAPLLYLSLFRYPRSLLEDPTPYSWEETWPSVEGRGHQTSSKEQRYTNRLLAEVLTHHFVTTVFTVLHHTLVWVSYTCARTHQGSPARPAMF